MFDEEQREQEVIDLSDAVSVVTSCTTRKSIILMIAFAAPARG